MCRLEAAEAENARLRALPLKDEVERVWSKHWEGRYFGATDDKDAEALALFLSKDMLPEVRMKNPQQRELQHLAETRDLLVK